MQTTLSFHKFLIDFPTTVYKFKFKNDKVMAKWNITDTKYN